MRATDVIARLNQDVELASSKRACGKWIRTSNSQSWVAYNISRPPHRGPGARRVIMRLMPVAGLLNGIEVALYTRADDRCQKAYRERWETRKKAEIWFLEGDGESGVKSTISLSAVKESEWQEVVAAEMDRLFSTYADVVEAEP